MHLKKEEQWQQLNQTNSTLDQVAQPCPVIYHNDKNPITKLYILTKRKEGAKI